MDVVSGISSVLTLIKVAEVLARVTRQLAVGLKNAPEELHTIAAQLLIVQKELEHVQYTSDHTHEDLITDDLLLEIESTLIRARDAVAFVDNICVQAAGNQRLISRIKWVRKDKDVVEEALIELRTARERLIFLLQILSCRGQSLLLKNVGEVKAAVLREPGKDEDEKQVEKDQVLDFVFSTKDGSRRLLWTPWTLGSNWAALGINGSLVPTEQGSYIEYSLAMQIHLPLARILGPYAFLMSVSVRTSPLCPGRFRFLEGGNLVLARILEEDHPFIVACDAGNHLAVRTMLRNKEGRSSDIVARNWNPLAFAIRSGNVDVVRELLDYGADVDGLFGQLQTTPLQWAVWQKNLDITRLLLARGASQDHINTIGWNSTFFCWPSLEPGERSMLDFLNLLHEDPYEYLDIADTEGWTALHRVAAYATPSEVIKLIKLGADPEKVALPLRWNAIHHAVFYGNHPAFAALLPYFGKEVVTMTDERGWSLLHIAASAGHDNIVRHLLQLGADSIARTRPFRSHIPECIFDKECTPQEVAAAQSQQREEQYLEVLREVDEEQDLEFWEASESLA